MFTPSEDLTWVSAVARAYRAGRDTSWWLKLLTRNAALDAMACEANRLSAEVEALVGPPRGKLMQSVGERG